MINYKKYKSFMRNIQGSMASVFAFSLTMIILAMGLAFDWSLMVKDRQHMRTYADAAVLAAAISGETDPSKLQLIAAQSVAANSGRKLDTQLSFVEGGTKALRVTVMSHYKPVIMSMFGKKQIDISALAEAPIGVGQKLNLAMVLDTTRSMEGSRMTTLKAASIDLLDALAAITTQPEDLKVSLVPFADYVRIDESHRDAIWLNVQPDSLITWNTLDMDASVNCYQVGSGETARTECDTEVYQEHTALVPWHGCMASRKNGYHKIPQYRGVKLQGPACSVGCNDYNSLLHELTSNLSEIKTAINNLNPSGLTYIPAGIIWGWRTLDPSLPFDETKSMPADETRNVLMLMTDGSNTVFLNGELPGFEGIYHWSNGSDDYAAKEANKLTDELCRDVKASGIEIITVAFEVTDHKMINLLRKCASSHANFYNASDSAALKTAFKKIGSGFNQLRLSR